MHDVEMNGTAPPPPASATPSNRSQTKAANASVRFEPAVPVQPLVEIDTDRGRATKYDSGVSLDAKDKEVTEYERALSLLATDATYQKEVSMGKRIALYKLGRELGSGNFAKVKAGVHVLAKEKVAVKIIDRGKIDQKSMKLLAREIANMDALHHPNVVQLFEVIETMSKVYLVLEFAAGGELYQYVLDKERLDEAEAAHLFAQVVAAVYHLHEHLIIHRDIKAENVFFASPGWVKLGDLGFSAQIEPGTFMKTFCGSPPYAAPELFRDAEYQGEYVDIWALGIMLYFLVVGNTPFRGDTVSELKRLILDGYFTIPESVTPFCQDLINGILKMQPTSRMNLNDIMEHYWLSKCRFPTADTEKWSPAPNEAADLAKENAVGAAVWARCSRLGVSPAMLRQHADKGVKSSVVGLYRIVQYTTLAEASAAAGTNNIGQPLTTAFSDSGYSSQYSDKMKKKRSRMCTIL